MYASLDAHICVIPNLICMKRAITEKRCSSWLLICFPSSTCKFQGQLIIIVIKNVSNAKWARHYLILRGQTICDGLVIWISVNDVTNGAI